MTDTPRPADRKDRETEYMGNIWGWKFSWISLAIILATIALMVVRYYTMDDPPDSIFFFPQQPASDSLQADTLQVQ